MPASLEASSNSIPWLRNLLSVNRDIHISHSDTSSSYFQTKKSLISVVQDRILNSRPVSSVACFSSQPCSTSFEAGDPFFDPASTLAAGGAVPFNFRRHVFCGISGRYQYLINLAFSAKIFINRNGGLLPSAIASITRSVRCRHRHKFPLGSRHYIRLQHSILRLSCSSEFPAGCFSIPDRGFDQCVKQEF